MKTKYIKENLLDNNIEPTPDLIDLILDIQETYYQDGYRAGKEAQERKNQIESEKGLL